MSLQINRTKMVPIACIALIGVDVCLNKGRILIHFVTGTIGMFQRMQSAFSNKNKIEAIPPIQSDSTKHPKNPSEFRILSHPTFIDDPCQQQGALIKALDRLKAEYPESYEDFFLSKKISSPNDALIFFTTKL